MKKNKSYKCKSKKNLIIAVVIAILVIIAVAVIIIAIKNNQPDDNDYDDFINEEYTDDVYADYDSEEYSEESYNNYADYDFSDLRHAPNMYIDWYSSSDEYVTYDAFTIDWKCTETADSTYWALHTWANGYSGFQDRGEDFCKVVLLSLWDLEDGTKPQVEYFYQDYDYGDFTHEGCGAYVMTPYEWEENVWYSMKIEITYEDEKTIFTQYIRKESEDWLKTAAISYPAYVEIDCPTHVFQEDFDFNAYRRSCIVRNAAGRLQNTDTWEKWESFIISSSYYPDENDENAMWDVPFACDFEIADNSIKIITGEAEITSNGLKIPYYGNF